MSTDYSALTAKKACTRCSTQKKRCDKVMPECGLCARVRQKCKYELPRVSSLPSPRPEILLGSVPFTPTHLKEAVIQKLKPLTREDIFSAYCRAVEPWFPIVSTSGLQSRLSLTWDETPLDVAILCLSIVLLTNSPPSSAEDENEPSEFRSLYHYTKSSIASTEGFGINSFLTVQSRILVTLFEVAHGFYPAAYISIGATVRGAEALDVHPRADNLSSYSFDDGAKREEKAVTWCGILILDRYIALESGPHPSLTRCRPELLHDIFQPTLWPAPQEEQDRTSPKRRLARLFEASTLLDRMHTTLNCPTAEYAINVQELLLTIQTLINLETILIEEIGAGAHLYTGGWSLCNTALLLAFENGSKLPPPVSPNENCKFFATTSVISVIATITNIAEIFTLGTQSIDFDLLPPFVTFLVYKAAAILTDRLLMDNYVDEKMRNLKVLRTFLKLVGQRWLGCKRYLMFLDEDTTPRMLKAIEQIEIL